MKVCKNCECELEGKQTMYCSEKCRHAYKRSLNKQTLFASPENCYVDDCNLPGDESIVVEHPDLKKLQLTLRVLLCKEHKYLLREVA